MLDFDVSSFCMDESIAGKIALKSALPAWWDMFSLDNIVQRCKNRELCVFLQALANMMMHFFLIFLHCFNFFRMHFFLDL